MARFVFGPVVYAFLCLAAWAAPETANLDFASRQRFESYEDNYLLWHFMRDNGWIDRDEKPLRARYSLRYLFANKSGREFFFSYTGEFDFYWFNARPSSPVINRISNPGLHLRLPATCLIPNALIDDHFELGFEHRSDGQVIEVTTTEEAQAAQLAYDNRDRPYFDQISRGSMYFSLKTRLSPEATGLPCSLYAKAKIYYTQNSEVTWGPRAGLNDRVADYDILSICLAWKREGWGQLEAQWTVGEKGLKTDSFELGWQLPELIEGWSLPFYLQWHHGPMNTLSNYTQRQDSVGVGLRFARF